MSNDDAPMSPATAGLLLGCCALIGVGFLVGLWYMNRSEDPLYKRDQRFLYEYVPQADVGNPREMQTGTNLWKDKNTGIEPLPEPAPKAPQKQSPPVTPTPAGPASKPS